MERVYLHIGLPKTGTTYLQGILWANQQTLAAEGVLLPGWGHRQHLWAALDVQGRDLSKRHPDAPGTWERLCEELEQSSAPVGLITHEFFCGATAEQAAAAVARLAPAQVHLIVTARDAAGMLAAGWQELVKNGARIGVRAAASADRTGEFSWETWDLHGVLQRWGDVVPPEQVHVLPIPGRGAAAEDHWHRFADVLGLGGDYPIPAETANTSLGAVQVELLRRINEHLEDFRTPLDKGYWIRGHLAEGALVHQGGERFAVDHDLVEDCRERSRRAVDLIRVRGFDVRGDVESLLVPADLSGRRSLDTVTEGELLEAATRLIGDLMTERRDRENAEPAPEAAAEDEPQAGTLKRIARRLRSSE